MSAIRDELTALETASRGRAVRCRAPVWIWPLLAVFLSGCTAFQERFMEVDTAEPPAELEELQAEVKADLLWSRDLGDGAEELYLKLRPAFSEGRVLSADREGLVSAYDVVDMVRQDRAGYLRRPWCWSGTGPGRLQ